MDDLEEFKSWHKDLMTWERFQDELERIKPTKSRQRSANDKSYPFFENLVGGTNWVLIFVRQCPLFGGQGRQWTIKKSPTNIDFVGLVFLLSPFGFSFGDPAGARTQDPNIKSVVLYLLSY